MIEIREYGSDLIVANVEAEPDWGYEVQGATHIRVSVPADSEESNALLSHGFVFADRMYDVSIKLAGNRTDYERMVRIRPELTSEHRQEIKRIAHNSFTSDRRFHVGERLDQTVANRVMDRWIDELKEVYVCRYKEEIAGFIALKQTDDKTAYIHMAAVEEKYRPAGIAVSMYAYIVDECRKKGLRAVKGYISSRNIPVMNLYAFLGGSFERATDVFIKEV